MTENGDEDPEEGAEHYRSDEVEQRDPLEHFEREFRESFQQMPPVNILVTGKTGVGKSTLINAVFRKPVAKTGTGKPVTKRVRKHTDPALPVTLYDTPGLELGQQSKNVTKDFLDIIEDKVSGDPKEHIHLLWYCITYPRVEEYEIALIKDLAARIPVVLVMTKVLGPDDQEASKFADDIIKLGLPIVEDRSVKTLGEKRKLGPVTIDAFGLDDLVELTYRVLPEEVRRAFINAQGVVISLKVEEARRSVLPWATTAAGVIGAVPIPFPDAGPLLALQLGMMARITVVMGVDLDDETKSFLIKGFAASGGITAVGRAAASFFLKFVPIAGSVINASVAGALTAALGEAYIRTCAEILKRQATGKPMPKTEMLEFLIADFKRTYKRKAQ